MAIHVRPRGVTVTKFSQYALADAVAAVSGLHPSRHRLAVHYLLDRGPGTGDRYAIIQSDGRGVTSDGNGTLPVKTLDGRKTYQVPEASLGIAAEQSSEHPDLADAIRPFHSDYDAQHTHWYNWSQN